MAINAPTLAVESTDLEHYLQRVQELGPLIDDSAESIERNRRLPAELRAGLYDAGLFRLLLEKRFNGAEVCPADFSRIISAVAKHDASTAWCLCQANGCSMSASFLDDDVADEIWGKDPQGVVAWGPGKSQAVREGDGFRVNAKGAFASGGQHATWMGTHATIVNAEGEPVLDDNGKRMVRTMLIPADKIVYEDIWHVMGMRGTASDGFIVDDVFVPNKYSLSRDNLAERRTDRPLYLFRQTNLYASGFSGVAMGIAQAMVDAFAELAVHKTPRHSKSVLNQSAVVQSDFARASIRLNAARTFLLSELDDIWASVLATGELTVAQRMRIRLATTHGIHEAKAVADTIYDAAGATAIFSNGPYERRFRDLHTVTQQAQGKKAHYETVGAYLLGNTANLAAV